MDWHPTVYTAYTVKTMATFVATSLVVAILFVAAVSGKDSPNSELDWGYESKWVFLIVNLSLSLYSNGRYNGPP